MDVLATIRRTAALTLFIFGVCVLACQGTPSLASQAAGSSHDCCPRPAEGRDCPDNATATACGLNALDLPKASATKIAVVGTAAHAAFDDAVLLAGLERGAVLEPDPGGLRLNIRLRVLRI